MIYKTAFLTFILSFVFLRAAQALAHRLNLMDVPGGRKTHDEPTPSTGGIALSVATIIMLLGVSNDWPAPILVGITLMTVLGIVDDKLHLPAKLRLVLQAGITFVSFYYADIKIGYLGDLLGNGSVNLGWLAWPFTVICVCGLINAINMIDGLDGLAGGIVAGSILLIMIAQQMAGHSVDIGAVIVLSALTAFLLLNARYPGHAQASIFMGDGGSYFLGFTLAYMICRIGSDSAHQVLPPIAAAWILAYPALSTVRVMVSRVLRKVSPFEADRDHLHQLLVDERRFSIGQTVVLLTSLNLLMGSIGIYGLQMGWSEQELFIGLVACLPAMFLITDWARNRNGQLHWLSSAADDDIKDEGLTRLSRY